MRRLAHGSMPYPSPPPPLGLVTEWHTGRVRWARSTSSPLRCLRHPRFSVPARALQPPPACQPAVPAERTECPYLVRGLKPAPVRVRALLTALTFHQVAASAATTS